jgi:dolichol-phosphate mannosyltransferase
MDSIVVILPTFNESENLPIIVPKLINLGFENLKVLIVDDDSPDGTGIIAEELSLVYPGRMRIIHRIGVQRGLGAAYLDGFRKALADGEDIIITMDADLSHDPSCILSMIDLISNHDLVIGSRYIRGGSIDGNWGISRLILSHLAQRYIQLILGINTRDSTSAYRCYRRSTLNQLDFSPMWPSGFSFLIEVIYQAEQLGLNLVEIPIVFLDRTLGESKVTPLVILEAMIQVGKIRLNSIRYGNRLFSRVTKPMD